MGVGCGCGCCCRGLVWHEHWVSRAVIRWITVDNEGFYHVVGGLLHFLFVLSFYSFVFLPMSLFRLLPCYICLVVVLHFVEFVFVVMLAGWLVVVG